MQVVVTIRHVDGGSPGSVVGIQLKVNSFILVLVKIYLIIYSSYS